MAALRGGGGLVHCALPEGSGADKPYPEVIAVTLPGEAGRFAAGSRTPLFEEASGFAAVALGPGLGRADESVLVARELFALDKPLLVDADGLFALGSRPELLAERLAPTVLTPHEGELARLLGVPAAEVAAGRLEHVRSAATRSNATVLLKGEATIVAEPSGRAYVVPTGNPGLATPGTGDVLSGVIAAQLAKGLGATQAACLGAYLHGFAADLAADDTFGTEGLVAGDLLTYLPAAIELLKTTGEEEHEHD
jgi:NAD(P)H-hydrate epimerase